MMKPLSIRSGAGQAFVPAGGTGWRRWFVWLAAVVVATTLLMAAPWAAAVPTPEPAAQAALATLEISCTPSTFRIGEWVTVECVTHVVNRGDRPLSNVSVSGGSPRGDVPDTYEMWGTRDGQLSPLEPDAPIFRDYGVLQAGQSTESHT